jgi:hypothetical protein
MLLAGAVFTAAGGYIHLREWIETYREVPASAPGAAVVRIGFPVNAGVSLVLAVGLALVATLLPRLVAPVVVASILFQAGSIAVLIGTRVGTVLGWTEPVWTPAADQTRAVEIGALLALGAASVLLRASRREPSVAR